MTVVQDSGHFYVRRFRTALSIRRYHIWQWCSTFPAILSLPYCQSFARFFCSMVWNPCKQAVFLPYCQSFAWSFCSMVNIHRHIPIVWFICNDSCFCTIWPYFYYRYRPNGEFLCNDCSYEEAPVNFHPKSSPPFHRGFTDAVPGKGWHPPLRVCKGPLHETDAALPRNNPARPYRTYRVLSARCHLRPSAEFVQTYSRVKT